MLLQFLGKEVKNQQKNDLHDYTMESDNDDVVLKKKGVIRRK